MDAFDYIIVGGGSAGCVLADRLSADPRNSVLLVESGPTDWHPYIHMPRGIGKLLYPGSPYLSSYTASRGGNRGDHGWIKGQVLGGSSSVNGMVYVRGHPADYDGWREAGCEGWGWDDIGRCFKALENHVLGEGPTRGAGGPLKITLHPASRDCDALIEAGDAAGTPRVADLNDAPDGGIGYCPRTVSGGRRQSAAKAFLRAARKRPNLEVRTGSKALRVLFDGRKATGVEVRDAQGVRTVRARKEIILSAGAIESPLLLQRSGVGDPQLLKRMGIDVVAASPDVGRNLQEHPLIQMRYHLAKGGMNSQFRGLPLVFNALRYALTGKGPLTYAAFEVCAFTKTGPQVTRPDVQLGFGFYTLTRGASSNAGVVFDSRPGMQVALYALNPESRGELRITSPDPDAAPYIDANYLDAEEDRRSTIGAVRFVRKMVSQPVFAPYVISEVNIGEQYQTDDEILGVCLEQCSTSMHVSSTCRMGADDRAVVDPKLRVRGVEGLRVVDTSIFPSVVAGNTNGPVMAAAWRAAELILN